MQTTAMAQVKRTQVSAKATSFRTLFSEAKPAIFNVLAVQVSVASKTKGVQDRLARSSLQDFARTCIRLAGRQLSLHHGFWRSTKSGQTSPAGRRGPGLVRAGAPCLGDGPEHKTNNAWLSFVFLYSWHTPTAGIGSCSHLKKHSCWHSPLQRIHRNRYAREQTCTDPLLSVYLHGLRHLSTVVRISTKQGSGRKFRQSNVLDSGRLRPTSRVVRIPAHGGDRPGRTRDFQLCKSSVGPCAMTSRARASFCVFRWYPVFKELQLQKKLNSQHQGNEKNRSERTHPRSSKHPYTTKRTDSQNENVCTGKVHRNSSRTPSGTFHSRAVIVDVYRVTIGRKLS